MPSEIENAVPFEQDRIHAQYDRDYVARFQRALVQADRVMNAFRARFIGKVSPVHFFWGSFDLAVTRFSGRTAPPPTGVTPNVASWVMAEAYSHEVSSCGFWPGNGGYGRAASMSMPIRSPTGYGDTPLSMTEAFYDKNVGQFILPYDAVRERAILTRCCFRFCKRPTRPQPIWPTGIARPWSARRSSPALGRARPDATLSANSPLRERLLRLGVRIDDVAGLLIGRRQHRLIAPCPARSPGSPLR